MAVGDCFEECPEGCIAPHYNIDCQNQLDGKPMVFTKGNRMEQMNWLDRKLYDCLICCDEKTVTCNRCSSSGEGMADGSKCTECGGTGEVPCSCVEE